MRQFLASADSDGNGTLSKEEFKNGISKFGLSDEEATAFVNEACLSFIICFMPICTAVDRNHFSVLR